MDNITEMKRKSTALGNWLQNQIQESRVTLKNGNQIQNFPFCLDNAKELVT